MNAKHSIRSRGGTVATRRTVRQAFTMVELLIVVGIIALLMTVMVAAVGSSMKTARVAATSALIQKLDNLLDERTKGFDRATKSADFQRIVTARKQVLESGGIFGVSPDVLAVVARKDFFRSNFPQRFEDLASPDVNTNGVPDLLESVPGVNLTVLTSQVATRHVTESSELLYFMLTRMQAFGVPPVGDSEFGTSEVRDTDEDGLLEFVDGWGNPLRFYRWPTRLLKPNGIRGFDNQYGVVGVDDDGNGMVDDSLLEFGKVNSDDINVPWSRAPTSMPFPPTDRPNIRAIAAYLIDGLPSAPVINGQWDSLSDDPDDPYGLISTEIKRLFVQSNGATNVMSGPAGFNEMNYPTIDTYHTPLIISAGADGDFGLYPPNLLEDLNGNTTLDAGEDTNGNGVLDYGILAQPIHGPGGPYDITTSVNSTTTDVISALTDNITNRNRRAGRGK